MNTTLEIPTSATEPKAVKPLRTLRRKILLVDDDPGIRHILVRLLAEEDYLVLTAANGVEALELAKSIDFDLVLLDLNMPVKNGWETFEQLSTKKPLDFVKLFSTIHNLLEEPAAMRMSRYMGRPSVFSYIPPDANRQEGRTN